MFETSSIELSTEALRNNIRFIRKNMKKNVRLCSVVKGNAYGHGLSQFVEMAMKEGVDYFAVHAIEEAYHLKAHLSKVPDLFIMGAMENEHVEWAVENQIEFSVFDFSRLNAAIVSARKLKTKAKVHIEIETGMRRTGFEEKQIPEICQLLIENKDFIIFQGLFTHFAGAESQANHFRIAEQILNFNSYLQHFENEHLKPIYNHTACSAALLNYPDAPGNMVRIGILQYGFWPNAETHIRYGGDREASPDLLKRIIRWTTKVMTTKEVKKGSFVGYGTSYFAHKKMNLAIIPVGYSHGYGRNLSNIGSVLIHGKTAPVVGTINMNSLTVDITAIEHVEKGDEVVLIGKQNAKSISVNSFSEQSNQLNYELLTRLPINIPRIIK
jgi:alanine racemase